LTRDVIRTEIDLSLDTDRMTRNRKSNMQTQEGYLFYYLCCGRKM